MMANPHPQSQALRVIFEELGVDPLKAKAAMSSDDRFETLLLATNYQSEDPLLAALTEACHEPISVPMGPQTQRLLGAPMA